MKGCASLYYNMKNLETAKEYQKRIMKIIPDDPETYYAIAVIDWTEAYQPRMEQRAKLNLKPEAPLINAEACWRLRAANEELVKDGIEMLAKAITLRSDYDDAMAYMNLMYRELADIQCSNTQAYTADIRKADEGVDLTLATKKKKTDASPAQSFTK